MLVFISVAAGVFISNLLLFFLANLCAGFFAPPHKVQWISAGILGFLSAFFQLQGIYFVFFLVWPSHQLIYVNWSRRFFSAFLSGIFLLILIFCFVPVLQMLCTLRICSEINPPLMQGFLGGAALAMTLLPFFATGFLSRRVSVSIRPARWGINFNILLLLLGFYSEYASMMVDFLGVSIFGYWSLI